MGVLSESSFLMDMKVGVEAEWTIGERNSEG